MTSILARLIAVLAALCLLVACGGQDDSSGDGQSDGKIPDTPVITGEPASYNGSDITFANTTVKQHQQAIELSKLVPQRSTNAELVALADRIVATHQPEINILNVFLVQWNENPEVQTGPEAGEDTLEPSIQGMVDDATVAKLESLSGPEFDKLWLASMISQLGGGVAIARSEIADGANADAISVAETMVAEQEADIGQMKKLLEALP